MDIVTKAPDTETGAAAPATPPAAASGGETVDPKRDLDDPGKDLYPDPKPAGETDPAKAEEAGEAKPAGETDPAKAEEAGEAKPADPPDLTTVPEDGKYHIKLADDAPVDQALLDAVSPLWKEKGLTHEDAQKLTDVYAEQQAARDKQMMTEWETTVEGWAAEAKADKDIGGDKWDQTVSDARRAIDKFGNDELKKALDNSGMGNHPEVIRMFASIGNDMKDDDIPTSDANSPKPATNTSAETAEALYGGTTPITRS